MTKQEKIASFDPSGVGLKNGHFIGLPFSEEDASIVLVTVPWDVTVSYNEGTASGPQNILECSTQLDLFDPDVPDAWKMGIYMRHLDLFWLNRNGELRPLADSIIDLQESGGDIASNQAYQQAQEKINSDCALLRKWVFKETRKLLGRGKKVGVVGGEHSVPLGFLDALAEKYEHFGILQIDAHQDLRKAYEGFTYSHASIFYNAIQLPNITKLVQAGIRDNCQEEMDLVKISGERIEVWMDQDIREKIFAGSHFASICREMIAPLPQHVYISFDIDGLSPQYCPQTGTPVPGGLSYQEAIYLLKTLGESGREIIGFDLCEVAGVGNEWDGNVGARVLYKLCNFMGKSAGL